MSEAFVGFAANWLIGLTLRSTEARESLGLREACCRFAAELGTAGTGMNFSYGLTSSVITSGVLLWSCFKGADPGTAGKALRDGGTSQPLVTFSFFWSSPNGPSEAFSEVLVATISLEEKDLEGGLFSCC